MRRSPNSSREGEAWTVSAPQRALRPKVRAASLCPRALSTTKHASKLSHAPLLCDSSRSYGVKDSGIGDFGQVPQAGSSPSESRAALGKRSGLCGAVTGFTGGYCELKVLVAYAVALFNHALFDRVVVKADLPEALLRDRARCQHRISPSL